MEISRKTDYALRMLASLVNGPGEVISVRTAAEKGDVPYSFARSIQHDLATAGIVENTRGAAGGMRLSVDPRDITLLEIVEAVQGPVLIGGCLRAGEQGQPCQRQESCCYTAVWCNAERMLRSFFSSVTLGQIVAERISPVMDGGFRLVPEREARSAAGLAAVEEA